MRRQVRCGRREIGHVETFEEASALATAAAERIERAIGNAIAERGACRLALAGGSTPKRAYEQLSGRRIFWSKLHLWFGDERCVAPEHPDSNFAMARAALLERAPIPAGNVHRMRGEDTDRDGAARAYERELPASFDLIVLGIGPDGHTASLFPGSGALDETARRVVAVVASKPPPHRLTITPPVIASARELLVLAAGSEKAAAVRRALLEDVGPRECPARLARSGTWLLDREAAAELEGTSPVPHGTAGRRNA